MTDPDDTEPLPVVVDCYGPPLPPLPRLAPCDHDECGPAECRLGAPGPRQGTMRGRE